MKTSALEVCDLTVGEKIELRRRRRGLSRRALAELVGRSEEWMRLIETGRHPLDSVRMILRLAQILRIEDYTELIEVAKPAVRRSTDDAEAMVEVIEPTVIDNPGTGALRRAWPRYSSTSALAAEVHRCQETWENSPIRFSTLAQRLPILLANLRAENSAAVALEPRVRAYHTTCQLLRRIGASDLAWVVADRAAENALRHGCQSLITASAWHVGATLLDLGRLSACVEYCSGAAGALSVEVPQRGQKAALWGSLHLLAARAATMNKDEARAQRSLAHARDAARAFGSGGTYCGIPFGPSEINFALMETALSGRDFGEAVRIAGQVDFPEHYPIAATARYHIALAYGFVNTGEYVAATLALDKAATVCPEDLRFDADAQRTLYHLMRNSGGGRPRREISRLAKLAHVG
ncbi:helix-turn-helix domain-containing protein [Nocardia sp. XZ_19_385]|uniref:helix-turn-helix domain-containing protein n=1 Tax=Nocardia sp. XZ_19_385 TaxID=2769488 RepID=UPI00188E3C8A|nr:helix-turn-helix domain-containing protein [Nocardia sp. XZ_19_385]